MVPKCDKVDVTELHWSEVRESVKKLRPKLALIIDQLSPNDQYTFYKVSYQFGMPILQEGVLYLPTQKGKLVPINHECVPSYLKEALMYSTLPLGLILTQGNEVYLEMDDRVVSLAFFSPGVLLGLWELVDSQTLHFPRKIWNVSAGARSVCMLPKISDNIAHQRLKKTLGIRSQVPRRLQDHHSVFVELSRHPDIDTNWHNEILFFSKKIMEDINEYHQSLHNYLLKEAWKISAYWSNQITRDVMWEMFAGALAKSRNRPAPHILDTLKHVIAISMGAVPGYKPAEKDITAGPIDKIQSVYYDVYGIQYAPIIMRPYHLNISTNDPVYYSLQMPTLLRSFPQTRSNHTVLSNLRELKFLIQFFIDQALDGNLRIEGTPVQAVIDNVQFQYFHSEADAYGEIELSKYMLECDPSLSTLPKSVKDLPFAESAPFIRGCIRISSIYS